MAICFEGQLITDWTKIARAMRELGKRNEAAAFLWDFLDFVVTHRTPLFILMQPFIFQKVFHVPTWNTTFTIIFAVGSTANIRF